MGLVRDRHNPLRHRPGGEIARALRAKGLQLIEGSPYADDALPLLAEASVLA